MSSNEVARRMRLMLGGFADKSLNSPLAGDAGMLDVDRHLGFLYDRAYGEGRGMRRQRSAGLGASSLTTPDWLGHVKDLFPKECLEIVDGLKARRKFRGGQWRAVLYMFMSSQPEIAVASRRLRPGSWRRHARAKPERPRKVSTTLRQLVFGFKLGLADFWLVD